MKKIALLTVACSIIAGCSYLGEPEAYTIVEEETAPVAESAVEPTPAVEPAPVVEPAPSCGCGSIQPTTGCGCGSVQPTTQTGACQINPGMKGPLVIEIPAQSVCIK